MSISGRLARSRLSGYDLLMIAKLIALTLPLSLDSFLMAAAIGLSRPTRAVRLRLGLVFAAFEGGMPLIGLIFGDALSHKLGHTATYLASGLLIGFGLYTAIAAKKEEDDVKKMTQARGLTLFALGLGISLDGLAIGFTYGLLHLPVAIITAIIVAQAFIFCQLGFMLGRYVPESWQVHGERLAGLALVGIGGFLLI
jgi:putative Mn2+ efflux pump MntP